MSAEGMKAGFHLQVLSTMNENNQVKLSQGDNNSIIAS